MDFRFFAKLICCRVLCCTTTLRNLSVKILSELDPEKALKIPIAHGEGRFYGDENCIASLIKNDQILFKYCDENGIINEASNPNGSVDNIAGICNEKRNIFGMMPHPERAADVELSNADGKLIFDSILASIS